MSWFTWLIALFFAWGGYKVGRLYGNFSDLMLARRVSALSKQAEKLETMRREWERGVPGDD